MYGGVAGGGAGAGLVADVAEGGGRWEEGAHEVQRRRTVRLDPLRRTRRPRIRSGRSLRSLGSPRNA